MGRSLSPILRRELENLDKDADSRKSAMKALKSYVKELDSKAIPLFLAQVSETKEAGVSSGEYTISLYEVLARVHGPKIVPQIDNIMCTIIKTLTSSAGSFPLHQACSKVVPAIARYGMDPTTPEGKKTFIIHSLAKPLLDCLLGSQESLSSGAALCLKALVDSDNWRFASNEMVNEVCQCVTGALEKHSQTNNHMALVTSLAKHNSLIVEAYARLLIQTGLSILGCVNGEGNSQKRLSAVHMVNSLMRYLDPRSILSEMKMVIEEMEICQSDKMPYVRGAAFEALQMAKRICSEKGSNFDSRGYTRRNMFGSGDHSPLTASPESQTLDSFQGFNSFTDSPLSTNQTSRYLSDGQRSVNRKLWRRHENGLDVSLKDGIFSEVTSRNGNQNSVHDEFTNNGEDYRDRFAGFFPGSGRNGFVRSATPSPQRSHSHVTPENVAIFTTPRKLIHSLQDVHNSPDFSEKKTRRYRSLSACEFEWSPASYRENGLLNGKTMNNGDEKFSDESEQSHHQTSESVSSAEGASVPQKFMCGTICCLLIVVLAIFVFLWNDSQGQGYNLVPT
nr:protein SINE1 [Ipomoea batatas]GMD48032.1 protein SINE1 [Ipomoea batatas]